MPRSSPGTASTFGQILPGAPTSSLQSLTHFTFRQKRYVAYISGKQLNILASINVFVQAIKFDHELCSVIANDNGSLVIGTRAEVLVLEPVIEGWTKVTWKTSLQFKREDAGDEARWLCWGTEGEVLIGGSHALSLFSSRPLSRTNSPASTPVDKNTIEQRNSLWAIPVASPVLFSEFSPSATLIASCAQRDRLVKIWRRLSFEEGLFDHTYLPHPGVVTHLQWRAQEDDADKRRGSGISIRHEENPEILYTIASDGILRVWRTGGFHDADILVLHTTIDLVSAIPQSPVLSVKGSSQASSPPRYAFTIPSRQFNAALDAAISRASRGKHDHAIEHLKEIASQEPDLVVALDGHGRLSAWGISSIGHKRRPGGPTTLQPFHIAHAEGLPLRLGPESPATFEWWFENDTIHLLAHDLDREGRISWWKGDVVKFFSAADPGRDRLTLQGCWSGHETLISDVAASQQQILIWSGDRSSLWDMSSKASLRRLALHDSPSKVLSAKLLDVWGMTLTVHEEGFCLWDRNGQIVASASLQISQIGSLYTISLSNEVAHGLFIESNGKVSTHWKVRLTRQSGSTRGEITVQSSNHDLDLDAVCTVHSTTMVAKQQFDAVKLHTTPSINGESSLEAIAVVRTGIEHPVIVASNAMVVAIASADSQELAVLDISTGYIEHRQIRRENGACLISADLHPERNLLATSSAAEVEILTQGRYTTQSSGVPIWTRTCLISISGLGIDISALAWLSPGALAVTAGGSLLLKGANLAREDIHDNMGNQLESWDLPELNLPITHLSAALQTTLPVWHPLYLTNLFFSGRLSSLASTLQKLAYSLKFWSRGENLDIGVDDRVAEGSILKLNLSSDTIADLREQLAEKELPYISPDEQRRLKHIVETIAYLQDHVTGLDIHALRYLFDWKLEVTQAAYELRQDKPNGEHATESTNSFVPKMSWQSIAFAYQSHTQQPLLDLLTLHYDNKLTWAIAQNLGLVAWISSREALEQVFEQLAQSAYRSQQPADPVHASLYFLALHKKSTLLGLWRIATWHKEQRSTMNFLKRDFTQPDAQTAARKNAYALMGKRRFEYASAFFLLAADLQSAVNTLAAQCGDTALAIAVARLYCGDDSSVMRQLIEERILPQAATKGDRWLTSWCHSLLREHREAADALIVPLQSVGTWERDDPNLLLLYSQLRTTPESPHEARAVLRAAWILRKMGLWQAALTLVATWNFKPPPVATSRNAKNTTTTSAVGGSRVEEPAQEMQPAAAPRSLLDGFDQGTSAPPADDKAARAAKAAELLAAMKAKKQNAAAAAAPVEPKKKPEPTQFKEPDANSLLDSFGF